MKVVRIKVGESFLSKEDVRVSFVTKEDGFAYGVVSDKCSEGEVLFNGTKRQCSDYVSRYQILRCCFCGKIIDKKNQYYGSVVSTARIKDRSGKKVYRVASLRMCGECGDKVFSGLDFI